jgi:hypothetical protein
MFFWCNTINFEVSQNLFYNFNEMKVHEIDLKFVEVKSID